MISELVKAMGAKQKVVSTSIKLSHWLFKSNHRYIMTEVNSSQEFQNKIGSQGLTTIQFSASWCGPCKQIKPLISKFSDEEKNVNFLYVDIDEHSDLVEQFHIENVPTFVFLKSGKIIDKVIGANFSKVKEAVEKNK